MGTGRLREGGGVADTTDRGCDASGQPGLGDGFVGWGVIPMRRPRGWGIHPPFRVEVNAIVTRELAIAWRGL